MIMFFLTTQCIKNIHLEFIFNNYKFSRLTILSKSTHSIIGLGFFRVN